MNVLINGVATELAEGITLAEMLAEKTSRNSEVAVAINQQIICQTAFAETILHEGDNVLIFGAAKGG